MIKMETYIKLREKAAVTMNSITAVCTVAEMDEAPGKKQKQPSQVVFVL